MNNQTTTPIQNGVTKSPTASSGSQGTVAQLDDTRRGMSGNIRHPEGCLWKNNNNNSITISTLWSSVKSAPLLQESPVIVQTRTLLHSAQQDTISEEAGLLLIS